MKRDLSFSETGQTIILIALMLLGLIAMLALVLDGGNFYTQRRAAQVAADAGALAGAREYCLTEKVNPAKVKGYEYSVTRNEADNATVSVNGDGDVTVNTSITFDTFFLGILGRSELTATATATAGCSPANEAFVLPIAWSCKSPHTFGGGDDDDAFCGLKFWDEYDGIEDCDLETGPAPGDYEQGDYTYIVVDSVAIEAEVICLEPDGTVPPEAPEGEVKYVDCNFDDDGDNDVELLSGGSKSWLDIGATGGEPPELIDWIENGLDTPIKPHWWFAGQTGTTNVVYRAIDDFAEGNQVVIPVFDSICRGNPVSECPDQMHPNDLVKWPNGNENANNDFYHIISFSLFYPSCVEAAGIPGSCPVNNLLELPPQVKSVEGCFIEGFDADLGTGGGDVDTGADVVYLKK